MNDTTADRTDVQSAIDREVELVSSGIDLVASGGALSATIGNLRLAGAVLEIVAPRARAAGVILEPLWGPDEVVTDIHVRRGSA